MLTKVGFQQHRDLMNYFQSVSPTFFDSLLPRELLFVKSKGERIESSLEAQIQQLNIENAIIEALSPHEDPFRFVEACPYSESLK